jgi:serine/threonine protein kinase
MSGTFAEIERQAAEISARITAEAHRDIERIAAEASRALAPNIPSGGVPVAAPTQATISDGSLPDAPPPPDPMTIAEFKQAWRATGSAPVTNAPTDTPARQARPWPEKIDLARAHIAGSAGSGGFGAVSWIDTGMTDAPPLVFKQGKTAKNQDELKKEAEAYKKVGEHPNIARCLGMQTIDGKEGLVMEGIKGKKMTDAMDRLEKLRRGDKAALKQAGMTRALSQEEYVGTLQYMVTQILQGLVHLQQQTVSHNDIRPDNVMCDAETGEVKIVDFGLSFDMGLRPDKVELPFGWGSAAPELATRDAMVIGKADVFSAGEVVRKGMEGDQFRYNTDKPVPKAKDAKAFAQPDADGKPQQALNRMAQPSGATSSESETLDERFPKICGRLSGLIADPFIAGTENAKRLPDLLARAPAAFGKAKAENKLEDAKKILADLEKEVQAAEARLKHTGTFGAETDYTQFVNALMHPDPSRRLSAVDALRHPFITDRLLPDAAAQAVLKAVLADPPADNSGASVNSDASGTSIVPLGASNNPASGTGSLLSNSGKGGGYWMVNN